MTRPHESTDAARRRKAIEETVFEAARGLDDPSAREEFLAHWFRDDPAALARMRDLLDAADASTSFFMDAREDRLALASSAVGEMQGSPDSPPLVPEEIPGSRIGRYRLIRRIGEGGSGVVYEAEQEAPVRRKVALKIIRLGMDTEAAIARFEIERQALAIMNHPNIAPVFDAGATATGRPYFVMELVEGERVTTWCDGRLLGVVDRLRLFIQICQAVQHAHQKGIVHRDLKPSNILVKSHAGAAVPKIIDFGIAKAAAGSRNGLGVITEHDQIIGTPSYMSPEQIDLRGIDIDTRSDVYSLGVLLYELLAGHPPFDEDALSRAGASGMRRMLLEEEPPPPSRRFSLLDDSARAAVAAARRTDPSRLASLLHGDLDAIVTKAMEKDRNRRYPTTTSLEADIKRFLTDQPVLARKPGHLYLLKKFIRRNRAACLSGAAVTLSLLAGLTASTWLFWRERQALAEQVRLSRETETARAEEDRLRAQAAARANISQVAAILSRSQNGSRAPVSWDFSGVTALIGEGHAEEASDLLHDLPLSSIDPSPDAAHVFRSLGHWNAMRGRWQQALSCFRWLDQANRFLNLEDIIEGGDTMCLGALLAEFGDASDYETFRRESMDRFLPVRSALAAEHLLKFALLLPADAATLDRLEQAMEMCASGALSESTRRGSFPQWNALAVAMYHHRRGDSPATIKWASASLSHPGGRGDRHRSAHCLLAMAHHHLGDARKTEENLADARALQPPPFHPETDLKIDVWLDWSVARILMDEAETTCR